MAEPINSPVSVITNGKEVMDCLGRGDQLILQGHQHYLEDLVVDGVHVSPGGRISGMVAGSPGHMKGVCDVENFRPGDRLGNIEYRRNNGISESGDDPEVLITTL
jgi:hypothetical protein